MIEFPYILSWPLLLQILYMVDLQLVTEKWICTYELTLLPIKKNHIVNMTYIFEISEYYCVCGNYLFNSSDICFKTSLFHQLYLWVEPKRDESCLLYGRVRLRSSNLLICSICCHRIGAVVFPFCAEREMLRFSNHLISQKKLFMIKENGIYKLIE